MQTIIYERNLGLVAAGISFYALFAVFPGIGTLVAIWSLFSDPAILDSYLSVLDDFLPKQASSLVSDQVHALSLTWSGRLGWGSLVSLVVALWSARAGVDSLVQGLDSIHGHPSRGYAGQAVMAIILTLGLMAMVMAALGTVILLPVIFNFVSLGPWQGRILAAVPWAGTMLLIFLGLILCYMFGPNARYRDRISEVVPGALLASALWIIVSLALSLYLANFGNYNRIYGSLGAVVALMMWFYVSAWVALLGAALNEALKRDIVPAQKDEAAEKATSR